jgi:hypothetical protein
VVKSFGSPTDDDPIVVHVRICSNPVDDFSEEVVRKLFEQHVDGVVIEKGASYQIVQIVSAFFLPQTGVIYRIKLKEESVVKVSGDVDVVEISRHP